MPTLPCIEKTTSQGQSLSLSPSVHHLLKSIAMSQVTPSNPSIVFKSDYHSRFSFWFTVTTLILLVLLIGGPSFTLSVMYDLIYKYRAIDLNVFWSYEARADVACVQTLRSCESGYYFLFLGGLTLFYWLGLKLARIESFPQFWFCGKKRI